MDVEEARERRAVHACGTRTVASGLVGARSTECTGICGPCAKWLALARAVIGEAVVEQQRIVEAHERAVAAALRGIVLERVEHQLRPVQHPPIVEARPVGELRRGGAAERGGQLGVEPPLHLPAALRRRAKAAEPLAPPLLEPPHLARVLGGQPRLKGLERVAGARRSKRGLVGKLPADHLMRARMYMHMKRNARPQVHTCGRRSGLLSLASSQPIT